MTDWLPAEPETARTLVPSPRRCTHPRQFRRDLEDGGTACTRCGRDIPATVSRQSRNNRKRGGAAELAVAKRIGAAKMGPLGLPWDVEKPGWIRLQVKKLAKWPSLNDVQRWMDAIPVGAEMRGVALIEAAGPGVRGRRLIVLDLDEFAEHHGEPL
jgi:hypothetical protein